MSSALEDFDYFTGQIVTTKKHPVTQAMRDKRWILTKFSLIEDYELWTFFQGFDTEHTLIDGLRDKAHSVRGE